jgi:YesN/AraC family two-component response regulator
MFFQPFQLHRVKAEIKEKEFYVRSKFLFEPSLVDKYFDTFDSLKPFFNYIWKGQLSHQVIQLSGQIEEFNMIFDFHRSELLNSGPTALDEFALFTCFFLQTLKKHWKQQDVDSTSVSRNMHRAEEIMIWIDANFNEEFSLDTLAHELHLTKYHMCHLFRKAIGSSISEYLISRRLREACFLLSTTSLSIQKICEKLGMTDASYFSQLFKKRIGCTPLHYRKTSNNN